MGKYYYVCITNTFEREISESLSNVVVNKSLGYSEPSADFLKDIKRVTKTKEEKFLGIKYKSEYLALAEIPLICEMGDKDYLTEIITGRKYRISNNYIDKPSSSLLLRPVQEIPSAKVIAILKSLTEEDLKRYRIGMQNLDYYMQKGYNDYLRRIAANKRQSEQDDEFIKRFRDRHGR